MNPRSSVGTPADPRAATGHPRAGVLAEDRPALWVGTSWKMNKTLAEAKAFIDEVADASLPLGLQPFVLPAHTALATVRDRLPAGSGVLLGAQNAHWAPEGAGTGEISMRMAADAGAQIIEMGHSERRASFGETDETVARKAEAALRHGLIPLICVGEPTEVRDAGGAESFVASQVERALDRLEPAQVAQVIVAYEPIWAIGAGGTPARVDEIAPVLTVISEVLRSVSGGPAARAVLYGGGVDADNAPDLLSDSHVDGLFVGRAGWTARGFLALLDLCAPWCRPIRKRR